MCVLSGEPTWLCGDNQVLDVDVEQSGDLDECWQVGLNGVGTPFGDGCWVAFQLCGEPFAGAARVGQCAFYSIYFSIAFHSVIIW